MKKIEFEKLNEKLDTMILLIIFFGIMCFFITLIIGLNILDAINNNNINDCEPIIIKEEQIVTKIIKLNNNNFGEHIKVIDYICDDGIKINKYDNWFYASAWEDAEVHTGQCMLKIKI